ncbi:uncharacterized protein LOC110772963 [Prunus avium]|uniref:Uncharacterized protein LOC110772963 n=1 Tax=Prunus avium TaxID=42229 RepID=A0A6P5U1V1_PRUAV|nr:uncharacterized protein LOC110772963 [Prunus avium]
MTGFINGKKIAPAIDDPSYEAWDEDNCLVQSWLLNSMTKNVRALFDHCSTAYAVWDAARKTYTVTHNSSKLYQLRRQSVTTSQSGEPVNVFYEKLHIIWQEIDSLRPCKHTNPDDVALHQQALEVERVYDFLGGLDPNFDSVRSQILAMNPLPAVIEAYALVVEEDNRQSSMLGGGSAMAVKPYRPPHRTSSGLPPRGPKTDNAKGTEKCTHCGGDHLVEKCFKLHGYPEWWDAFKSRNKTPKAACVITTDASPSSTLLSDSESGPHDSRDDWAW